MARLDSAKYAHSTASGMAAFTAIMSLYEKNDEFILPDDTYTGTRKCIKQVFEPKGMNFHPTDFTDL